MVQVPFDPVPSGRTSPRRSVERAGTAPVGAFGGLSARAQILTGRDIQRAGGELGEIALQMQEEDNETDAKQADARLAQAIREITLGNPNDPNSLPGFLHSRGETTLNTFSAAEAAIREAYEKEVTGASNQALRQLITTRGQRRVNLALDRMTGHASEQRLAVQDSASLAREANAFADVSADYNNSQALDDGLKDVAAEALDRAEANGLDEVTTAALVRERQSVLVKGAFDAALANSDVVRAQEIFSKHADKLDGATRTTMAQALARDSQLEFGQSLAQEAFAAHPGDPAAMRKYVRDAVDGTQESVAITELNSLIAETRADTRFGISMREAIRSEEAYERAIASEARAEANHLHALDQRARAEAIREAEAAAYNWLYQDQEPAPTLREFRRQNQEAYDVLAGAGRIQALVVTERNIREGQVYALSSNGETLEQVKLMPAHERAQIQLPGNIRSQVTEAEYKQIVNSVAAARAAVEADATNRPVYSAGRAALEQFKPRLFDETKSDKNKKEMGLARSEMESWIKGMVDSGNFPTQPEINLKAAELMMAININTGFFDGIGDFDGIAAARSSLDDRQKKLATVPFDGIPKNIVDEIRRTARVDWNGIAPEDLTDEIIEELAGALAMSDRERYDKILLDMGGTPITTGATQPSTQ